MRPNGTQIPVLCHRHWLGRDSTEQKLNIALPSRVLYVRITVCGMVIRRISSYLGFPLRANRTLLMLLTLEVS